MALTASTHIVIPSLIGRGLTENQARTKLTEARLNGWTLAEVSTRVFPIIYANGKYTIGG